MVIRINPQQIDQGAAHVAVLNRTSLSARRASRSTRPPREVMLKSIHSGDNGVRTRRSDPNIEVRSVSGKVTLLPLEERRAKGRGLRRVLPRLSQEQYVANAYRPDPVHILEQQANGRDRDSVAMRYRQMAESPLEFFRGSGAIMAWDLSRILVTNLTVQLCGDAHISNFGFFGFPERVMMFEVSDFDETMTGPWEWDTKRLVTSAVLAARSIGLSSKSCLDVAHATSAHYRRKMAEYAELTPLEIWYSHVAAESLLDFLPDVRQRQPTLAKIRKARKRGRKALLSAATNIAVEGGRESHQQQIELLPDEEMSSTVQPLFAKYLQCLPEDRRWLLDHYHFVQAARLIGGVNNVGMRQYVIVLASRDDDDLFALRFKEAAGSILSPYLRPSLYRSEAERIVQGQQLMQALSDPFLGWVRHRDESEFYVRQLFELPASPDFSRSSASFLKTYAEVCAETIARGHARSGDPVQIAAYIGKDGSFEEAIARFAMKYADQVELDHQELVAAEKSGRIQTMP